jgi:hypothetical protein
MSRTEPRGGRSLSVAGLLGRSLGRLLPTDPKGQVRPQIGLGRSLSVAVIPSVLSTSSQERIGGGGHRTPR